MNPHKSDTTQLYLWPPKRKPKRDFASLSDAEAAAAVADALQRPFECVGCLERSSAPLRDGYCSNCYPWVWAPPGIGESE